MGEGADPVGPDEGDAGVEIDRQLELGVEVVLLLAVVAEGDAVDGEHRRRQLAAVGEVELDGAVLLHLLREPRLHHLVDDLLLRLRLLHQVGVGPARRDELLEVLDVRLPPPPPPPSHSSPRTVPAAPSDRPAPSDRAVLALPASGVSKQRTRAGTLGRRECQRGAARRLAGAGPALSRSASSGSPRCRAWS